MSMGKRPTRTGAEYDAVSKYGRRYLCYLERGSAKIKRQMRRRERHDAKRGSE